MTFAWETLPVRARDSIKRTGDRDAILSGGRCRRYSFCDGRHNGGPSGRSRCREVQGLPEHELFRE
ncbi:protein of unknown function [Paraburkholderia kururiensis]